MLLKDMKRSPCLKPFAMLEERTLRGSAEGRLTLAQVSEAAAQESALDLVRTWTGPAACRHQLAGLTLCICCIW